MSPRDLEWSPSKLIRVEGGRSAVTKVDLDALLTEYGVTSGAERDRLQQLNRWAREPAWWDVYRNDISAPYLSYVGYEAGASFIRQFPGTVVPGLLQTEEYAKALTIGAVDVMKVNPVVKLRLQRQAEIAKRTDPPYQYYVLDEAVIRRRIGIEIDPSIMPNQLGLSPTGPPTTTASRCASSPSVPGPTWDCPEPLPCSISTAGCRTCSIWTPAGESWPTSPGTARR